MKRIISIFMALGILTTVSFGAEFSDIKGHWAEGYVKSSTDKGYFNGYPDGTFLPNNNITRMEFIITCTKFLNEVTTTNGLDTQNTYIYPDVVDITWALPVYKEFMTKVNLFGALNESDCGKKEIENIFKDKFNPSKAIEREEAVAIFNLFIDDKYKVSLENEMFPDIEAATFPKSIKTAAKLGIVKGYEDGTFRPSGLITRAEAATMLLNFENKKEAIKNITTIPTEEISNVYTEYLEPQEVVAKIIDYEKNGQYYNAFHFHNAKVAEIFGYDSYIKYMRDPLAHTYISRMGEGEVEYKVENISDNLVKVEYNTGDIKGIKVLEKTDGKWYAYFGMDTGR